jgi:mycothiol synthase
MTQVQLPDGYTMRVGDWDEFSSIKQLNGEFLTERYGGDNSTLEEVRAEWERPNWDIEQSLRCVYAPNDEMIAFMRVWDHYDVPVRPALFGFVSKAHRGKGIGTTMMHWAVEHSHNVIDRVPDHARVTIRAHAEANNKDENAIMQKLGFSNIRQSYVMQINMDERPTVPPLPEGFRMVSLADYDDLEVFVRTWRQAWVDHRGYIEKPIDKLVTEQKEWNASIPYFDPNLWLLALEGDTPVATCWNFKQTEESPTRGLVDLLAVRPEWRRRGLGMYLLREGFRRIYDAGSDEIVLGVDGASLTNATALYERAGMHIAITHNIYELMIRDGEELTRQS